MDGSVHEEKSTFKMLRLSFSSALDWGSYIISYVGVLTFWGTWSLDLFLLVWALFLLFLEIDGFEWFWIRSLHKSIQLMLEFLMAPRMSMLTVSLLAQLDFGILEFSASRMLSFDLWSKWLLVLNWQTPFNWIFYLPFNIISTGYQHSTFSSIVGSRFLTTLFCEDPPILPTPRFQILTTTPSLRTHTNHTNPPLPPALFVALLMIGPHLMC